MGVEEDFASAAEDISNNVNKTLSDDELKEVWPLTKPSLVSFFLAAGLCPLQAGDHWGCEHFKTGHARLQGCQSNPFKRKPLFKTWNYEYLHHTLKKVLALDKPELQFDYFPPKNPGQS